MSRFDSTCWTTVLGAAAGNATDRDTFCRQYAPVIRACLSARWKIPISRDEISEGAQEVFLQCFAEHGALERVDPSRPAGFRAYLYGVTSRVAANLERRAARNRQDHSIPDFDPDRVERSEATLSAVFDRAWAEMLGREARLLLSSRAGPSGPAALRLRCLELRFVDGMPPRDIAPHLGVDIRRVYEMLSLVRKEYRAAVLDVISSYHPDLSRKEQEVKFSEFAALL